MYLCEPQTMKFKRPAMFLIMLFVVVGTFAFSSHMGFAQDTSSATSLISEGLQNAGEGVYSEELTVSTFVGNLIRTLLAATGIVFLIITVYAGVLYMTAAGDTEKIKKAKGMLTSSVIGIIIIVGAYAITTYVIDAISTAATQTSAPTESAGG